MPPLVIGHRGCPPRAPENSLAGIRRAAELGADGIEIDVRRALDGTPVVFHDAFLRRITGFPGPVGLYPSFLLRRLRILGSDERIPTLAEALDAVPDGRFLAIEIKDASTARAALRLLRERGDAGRHLIWSYRIPALEYFAAQSPETEPCLLRDDTDPEGLERYLQDARRCRARAISPHWHAVTPQFVGEAHGLGLRVFSMNRDLESVPRKVATGVDGIVTDTPAEVRAAIEGMA